MQDLRLRSLQECLLSQLARFINSFPALTSLLLDFDFEKLEDKHQALPKPCYTSTRALSFLEVDIIPGSSKLIDWFLKAGSLIASLESLVVYCFKIKDEAEFILSFWGIGQLLGCCRTSLRSLSIYLENEPIVKSVTDISMSIVSLVYAQTSTNIYTLVRLDLFRLQKITYGSYSMDHILSYVVQQLEEVSLPLALVEVCFDIRLDESELDEELCKSIDQLLSSDKFPSLRVVDLHETIPFDNFPNLYKNGILTMLPPSSSYWP